VGALVSFVGLVRDYSGTEKIESIYLEHYPGMCEKALEKSSPRRMKLAPARRARHPPRRPTAAERADRAGGHRLRTPQRRIRRLRIHHRLPEDRSPILEARADAARHGVAGYKDSDVQRMERWDMGQKISQGDMQ